jgi:hypothetical protein
VVSYLLNEQPDWQLDVAVYRTTSSTISMWAPLSGPSECTRFSRDQLREKLVHAGNMFAQAENLGAVRDFLCLPPNSTIEITADSVVLTTRVCRISVDLKGRFAEMDSRDPRAASDNRATLKDGTPRFANVVLGARVTISYDRYHAQARDLPKYQAWTKRLVEGLKVRFAL